MDFGISLATAADSWKVVKRAEAGADLIVTGNLRDAKQGLGIIVSRAFLESALVLQKGWRWREEDAKGASGGVWNRITGIGAGFAMIRQVLDALVQDGPEIIKASGVRHRCLLGSRERSTLAKSVSIDNLEPLVKPKLALLAVPETRNQFVV